jgi:ATP-dependent RNA helicase RhlE
MPYYNSRFARHKSKGRSRRGNSRRSRGQKIDRSKYINDLQDQVVEEKNSYQGKEFAKAGFDHRLMRNISAKGFHRTTEIQERAIPLILAQKDVLGISATGSGKTAAFLIPMIQKMLMNKSQRLLIVAPTRELALQIAKETVSFVKGTHIRVASIIGGESMGRQIAQLEKGAQIVIGTPGRMKDLIERGKLPARVYNNIVVDEVDRMMDMGFIRDIEWIFRKVSQKRQSLFFSATLNKTVEHTVTGLTDSYEVIKLAQNEPSKNVVQSVVDFADSEEKITLLHEILDSEEVQKTIIFVDTKHYADKVDKMLFKKKYKVGVIHGGKRQTARKRVITRFKESEITVLVATNVAARGIDIDDITHVINLDEPQSYDEYIHRIGRTGRNGSLGAAYTFVKRRRLS